MGTAIPVVAAVIRGREGKILISRRPAHLHQGGKWEFPGGKIEAGEAPQAALARELREELGITPIVSRPLIQIRHAYPDKEVFLDVWEVLAFSGQPTGREGQAIEWVETETLHRHEFPEANAPIVKAARLPAAWLITPEPASLDPEAFFSGLEASLEAGAGGVILRSQALAGDDLVGLVEEVAGICSEFEVPLTVNVKADIPLPSGVMRHLTSDRLTALDAAPAGPWSVSCHTAADLVRAASFGAEFALLSPVAATASHPEAVPLGWEGFAALVLEARLPVYALGGMGLADAMQARRHGGQGVAGISGFWKG